MLSHKPYLRLQALPGCLIICLLASRCQSQTFRHDRWTACTCLPCAAIPPLAAHGEHLCCNEYRLALPTIKLWPHCDQACSVPLAGVILDVPIRSVPSSYADAPGCASGHSSYWECSKCRPAGSADHRHARCCHAAKNVGLPGRHEEHCAAESGQDGGRWVGLVRTIKASIV